MVFFTCNTCGASLKKNQVEKHYQNECRNCDMLSCMDCGKDFYGDAYAEHTKCVTEAEKYQGAMYKETNKKGDKKQEAWLEKARGAIQSAKVNKKLTGLLERMVEYPNIPRKKKKFENFVRNSFTVRDQKTLDDLWNVFNETTLVPAEEGSKVISSQEVGDNSLEGSKVISSLEVGDNSLQGSAEVNGCDLRGNESNDVMEERDDVMEEEKKKKRKKKENKVNLEEQVSSSSSEVLVGDQAISDTVTKVKKSKLKKRCLEAPLECEVGLTQKKKKKKKLMINEDTCKSSSHKRLKNK